nr:MAG TPA: hypothetical protein [Bacteriophage sp.]DAZ42968.1 MAG TPA: hypothetical protein [Caudoviricetes sp.]
MERHLLGRLLKLQQCSEKIIQIQFMSIQSKIKRILINSWMI